jgi:hypothetical protein
MDFSLENFCFGGTRMDMNNHRYGLDIVEEQGGN